MGLFQKKLQTSSMPFYRVGPAKYILIIGLGNPGNKYDGTRHNVGFAAVDNLAEKLEFPNWSKKADLKCQLTAKTIADYKVLLIKPTTFMNLSGNAAIAVAKYYKIPDTQITAAYDDLDVEFGQIRTRTGGSSAGHNGVQSLIDHLGANFGRLRIGIGPATNEDGKDYVLGNFSASQKKQMPLLLQETNSILSEYIYRGELLAETRSFII